MAITKIEKWATSDGQLFDTQEEAEDHEHDSKGERLAARILEHHANHFGLSDDTIKGLAYALGSSLTITARRMKRKAVK